MRSKNIECLKELKAKVNEKFHANGYYNKEGEPSSYDVFLWDNNDVLDEEQYFTVSCPKHDDIDQRIYLWDEWEQAGQFFDSITDVIEGLILIVGGQKTIDEL